MELKLGCAVYTYLWSMPLESALHRVADLGFTHVEIMTTPPHCWPRAMDQVARRRLRDLLESRGLQLVALNPTFLDINIASLNPALRDESVRQIKETVELARDLGARIAIVSCGRRHPLIPAPFETSWELARPGLEESLELAERHDVVLGIENTPSLFVSTGEQCVEAVRRLGGSRARVVFDVANASMVEDPVAGLRAVAEHLEYVHLSDTDGVRWTHSSVGSGKIDFAGVAGALREIGYSGVSTLETTEPDDPDGSIRRSLETLLPLGWRP